ncbi:aminopeptidase Y [Thecamonas trahens ATCC 50062]|uniref:Aminopeptidase Y n=1 Tax=Thecamonas trahens ATCC 50062 TaxID=461836 RepID=A0A0L0DPC1_THETB|nr:aminopeptidase Y [Thecamonas trahens ATCC 50062]KNC54100.1 aminopeptidase Y [Thecamonas trahens ATCC 50062]|eukprot:XP_013753924.1 aminopeptidase Y [Thecamonas trahens ATCC 50062]
MSSDEGTGDGNAADAGLLTGVSTFKTGHTPPGMARFLRRHLVYRVSLCVLVLVVAVLVLALVFALSTCRRSPATSTPAQGSSSSLPPLDGWAGEMRASALESSLRKLMDIAVANGGNRAAGTAGYNASLTWIKSELEQLPGLNNVVVQPFTIDSYRKSGPGRMALWAHASGKDILTFAESEEYSVMTYSANGQIVDGKVWAVPGDGFGCTADAYTGMSDSAGGRDVVALVRRGECAFRNKAEAAKANGAAAVVVYNQGDSAGRMGVFGGTLGGPVGVPVVAIANAPGEMIAALTESSPDALSMDLSIAMEPVTIYTANVMADTVWGSDESIIVVGSHLDSVEAGPGINDNGSGTSLNLELARAVSRRGPPASGAQSKIRFAWWGGEELGLRGSRAYVESLSDADAARISFNANCDMAGSLNGFLGVYDAASADNQETGRPSSYIQAQFVEFFDSRRLAYHLSPFTGRSDYGPFLERGIPAGGGDTGSDEIIDDELRAQFGSSVGVQADTCYHKSCDTLDNVNLDTMLNLAQAFGHVIEKLAAEDIATLRAQLERPATLPQSSSRHLFPRWIHGVQQHET